MSRVRYVCLSDFHAGSKYSLLTHLDPETGKVQASEVSPALSTFAAALRAFLPQVCETAPRLILLGDILDMAFSRMATTTMVFRRCMEALFPGDGQELFSKNIVFLPGNHDHALWQSVRERLQLDLLAAEDAYEARFSPVTELFGEPPHCSSLLTQLCRSIPHLGSAEVRVAYPNWGIKGPNSTVLLHHGHFIEDTYRAISSIRHYLSGSSEPTTVEQLEAENGSWIDFGWSTLGAAGAMGHDIATLHSVMLSGRGAEDFLARLARLLAQGVCARIPFGAEPKVRNSMVMLSRALLDATVGQSAELERLSYLDVLSPAGLQGLRWYLNEPLRRQIATELTSPVTFIFGHTHKPFEDEIDAENYSEPVRVFNTGGWVLDEPRLDTVQGASMILIDEDLNVAALRLFGCPVNGEATPVGVHGTGRYSDLGNPLIEPLRRALRNTHELWQTFSETAARELELRSRAMLRDVHRADRRAADGRRLE